MGKVISIPKKKLFNSIRLIRVAAYCRVSTRADAQLESLESQRSHFEKVIRDNPAWESAGVYYDEGISGTKIAKRSGLQSMMKSVRQGNIDMVIVKTISRLARNTEDCLSIVRQIIECGANIFFEGENLNTANMESELFLSILGSIAESESESISRNVKWGIQKRFRDGTFKIATPPYGYVNIDDEMKIVPEEAEIVKRIFASALKGNGGHTIAKELNSAGIKSPRKSSWTSKSVLGILTNEKYTGDIIFQKTFRDEYYKMHINHGELDKIMISGHHESIISHEEYERVQKQIKLHGSEKMNSGGNKYLNRYSFSGIIICGECGSHLKRCIHSTGRRKYAAWCCKKHLSDVSSCSMKYITDDAVRNAFCVLFNKLIYGKDKILKPLLEEIIQSGEAGGNGRLSEIENELRKLRSQMETMRELLSQHYLSDDVYHKADDELKVKCEKLMDEKYDIQRTYDRQNCNIKSLKELIRLLENTAPLQSYSDEYFLMTVQGMKLLSREKIKFILKCGLELEESL